MTPHVFASCSSYLLGRLVGAKRAEGVITDIARTGTEPNGSHVPGARTLHALARLFDVTLRIDGGAVCIGKSRSRHFHAAMQSTADVWVTVDDDVEASPDTLRWLVEAVSGPEPHVCMAPYRLRGDASIVSVEWPSIYVDRALSRGGYTRLAIRGGFGLVAMNRAAMREAATAAPLFTDDDGETKPAAFLEVLTERGKWLGEDLAFFERVRGLDGFTVEALITGETVHAGAKLNLAEASV